MTKPEREARNQLFASRLAEAMERAGMTPGQVVARLNDAGRPCTPSRFSNWLAAKNGTDADTARALEAILTTSGLVDALHGRVPAVAQIGPEDLRALEHHVEAAQTVLRRLLRDAVSAEEVSPGVSPPEPTPTESRPSRKPRSAS